jgi:hypothetical protein
MAAALGMVDAVTDLLVLVLPLPSPLLALPIVVNVVALLLLHFYHPLSHLIYCHHLLFLLLAWTFLILLLTARP